MKRIILIGMAVLSALILAIYGWSNWGVAAEVKESKDIVPIHKDWTITFSKEMKKESFTEDTVQVTHQPTGENADITFGLREDGKTLDIYAPKEGYEVNQTYTVTISESVTSKGDVTMDGDFTHTFKTAEDLPAIGSKENLTEILTTLQKSQQETFMFKEEASMDTAESTSGSEDNASETNVQVDGVDEADLVKTDGEFIYFARNEDIVITKGTPAKDADVVSTIKDENFIPNQLYLYEDQLIVMGYKREPYPNPARDGSAESMKMSAEIMPHFNNKSTVYVYDIKDPASPEKVREISVDGSYLTSRMIDGQMYLLTNQYAPFYILEDQKAKDEDPRPQYKDSAAGDAYQPVPYGNMHQLPGSKDSSYLTVTSFDVTNADQEANLKTFVGSGDTVYMSKEHLYIAVRSRNVQIEPFFRSSSLPQDLDESTKIYQLEVNDGKVTYSGEAEVPGYLINQFAMDERNDSFRVATTTGQVWNDSSPSFNNLYTFDQSMTPIGQVEGLAKGERIYSVRFMEDRAYMVTFKQVDPLFVIDLKDPSAPEVLGELKIPGFSNYLHPIGSDHVIGIGQDTKVENVNGDERVRQQGVKLSLFDISDVSNPVEKDVAVIGGQGSYTDVNHNHKALYIHPNKNLFGLPIQVSEQHEFKFQGAYLYKVTPEDGFDLQTTVTHQQDSNKNYPDWNTRIERMVSIGDTLYTVSNDEMRAVDLETMEEMKTIPFPQMQQDE